jgi:hypothetical protein
MTIKRKWPHAVTTVSSATAFIVVLLSVALRRRQR